MLSKGCTGYLMHIVSKVDKSITSLQNTPIVCEFQDVFSNNLLRLAPEREVKFNIELALIITLISKALQKIVLTELYKLKK